MTKQITKPLTTDILSDEFEVPAHHMDLSELIDKSVDVYNEGNMERKVKREWKDKLNELIDEYNDRRKFKCYNNIR